jgi:hypothetical protein
MLYLISFEQTNQAKYPPMHLLLHFTTIVLLRPMEALIALKLKELIEDTNLEKSKLQYTQHSRFLIADLYRLIDG